MECKGEERGGNRQSEQDKAREGNKERKKEELGLRTIKNTSPVPPGGLGSWPGSTATWAASSAAPQSALWCVECQTHWCSHLTSH